jgi:two-component system, OmpR family, phosphate regulon sensor histidine kinase PhoR
VFRSVFFRELFLPFLVVIVLATAGLGVFAAIRLNATYMDSRKESLREELKLADNILRQDLLAGREEQVRGLVQRVGEEAGCRVTVIAADGKVVADNWHDPTTMANHLQRPEIVAAKAAGEGTSERASDTINDNLLYMAEKFDLPDGAHYFLRLAVRASDLSRQLRLLYGGVAGAALLLAVAAILISYRLTRRQAFAVVELTGVAQAIAQGDFAHRAVSTTQGEIGVLGKAINTMAGSLQDLIRRNSADKAELLTVLSSMAEGVVATDAEQNITVANDAAARLLGFGQTVAMGRPLWQVVRIDSVIKAAQHALGSGQRSNFELGPVNGRHLEITTSPIHGAEGDGSGGNPAEDTVRGLVLVIHDTTQSARYQELRKELVANVSHELRTPLTVIRGFVETLRDGALLDPVKGPEFLATIERHTGQLTNLVDDLLELSRLESQRELPHRQSVDVALCAKRAVDLLTPAAQKKNQTLSADIRPVPAIVGNPDYLERATANLIDNALKYTPEGGRIAVAAAASGTHVVIEVADNGIGIPADDLPRIFERFYRVDRSRSREMGGTGLGLSIVKHIAQIHGGSVEVSSTVGQGSVFRLKLPLATPGREQGS